MESIKVLKNTIEYYQSDILSFQKKISASEVYLKQLNEELETYQNIIKEIEKGISILESHNE